jgi:hypothetical protein
LEDCGTKVAGDKFAGLADSFKDDVDVLGFVDLGLGESELQVLIPNGEFGRKDGICLLTIFFDGDTNKRIDFLVDAHEVSFSDRYVKDD